MLLFRCGNNVRLRAELGCLYQGLQPPVEQEAERLLVMLTRRMIPLGTGKRSASTELFASISYVVLILTISGRFISDRLAVGSVVLPEFRPL